MIKTARHPIEVRFGQRLREWRLRNKITIRELSVGVQLSVGWLCDLENGKQGVGLANALKIARYTGHRLAWFVQEGTKEND